MPSNPNVGPTLFDDPDALPPVEEDLDAKIARIAAQPTKRLPSDDRLSAVHADVTGIQSAWDEALGAQPDEQVVERPARLYEMPGKDGRTNQLPNLRPHEAQAGKTDEEITTQYEINRRGAEVAREMIKRAQGK